MAKLPPHKDLSSKKHHYFPRSLQKFWGDSDAYVVRCSSSGKIDRSKRAGFGHIRRAHHIQPAEVPSPWDETFEHTFGKADSHFSELIEGIFSLSFPAQRSGTWKDRFKPVRGQKFDRSALAECVASLVVRSPSVRNLIELSVASYGLTPEPGKLISVNQKSMLRPYSKALADRGKFILARSSSEFIFGDGCLNNFIWFGSPSPMSPRCIVALTPNLAILYDCPRSYMSNDTMVSVSLSQEETEAINQITMTYSKDYIFYRSQQPNDLSELQIGAHRQLEYHRNPWLDDVFEALSVAWFQPE